MVEEVRKRNFPAEQEDQNYGAMFDRLSQEQEQPKQEPVERPQQEDAFLPVEMVKQMVGGLEDGIRNTWNGMVALGDEWQKVSASMAPEGIDMPVVKGQRVSTKAEDKIIPEAQGAVPQVTRAISQFLAPFSLFSKAQRAAGVMNKGLNITTSTAATGFFAMDPIEDNLADFVEEFPALQNPVTEFLKSDGEDTAETRLKTAMAEVLGLGVGAAVVAPMAKAIRVVKDRRDLLKRGYTDDNVMEAANMKREIDESRSLGQAVAGDLAAAERKGKTNAILEGEIDASKKTRAPSEKAIQRAEAEKNEVIKATFGDAEVSKDAYMKSSGFIDNPEVANLSRFISSKNPKEVIPWTETEARALGMTLDEAKEKVGTAGEFEAAFERLRMQSVADTAKVVKIAKENPAALDTPEGIRAFADAIESSQASALGASIAGRTLKAAQKTIDVDKAITSIDGTSKRQIESILASVDKDPEEAVDFVSKIFRASPQEIKDGLHYYWMNSVLSGPVTHMTNIAGNLSFMALRPVERTVAEVGRAGVNLMLGKNEKVAMREGLEMFYGMSEGFRDALKAFRKATDVDVELAKRVKEGTKFDETFDASRERGRHAINKLLVRQKENIPFSEYKKMGPVGMGMDLLARSLSAPTDFLGATDQFMKTMAARGQKRSLALRSALDDGLEGEEFARRIDNILNNTPADALEKKMLENINDASAYFARETVFQGDLGKVGNQLVDLRDKVPLGEYIIPFVKTPVNIMTETFLKRTPLGLASGKIRQQIAKGGVEGAEAMARMGIGTALMGQITLAYADGKITGAGPVRKADRDRWLETNQPWSIKVGDEWYQYNRIEPIGTLIGLGARLGEVLEHNKDAKVLSPEEQEEATFNTIASMTKYTTDKSILTNIDLFLDILGGGATSQNALERMGAQLTGGFVPFSGAVRQAAGAVDPELRDAEGVLDRMASGLPGLSETLPNKRNRFGDKVYRSERTAGFVLPIAHTPGGVRDERTRKINEMEAEAGFVISKPSKFMQGVELSLEEMDRRLEILNEVKIEGKDVKDALLDLRNSSAWEASKSVQKLPGKAMSRGEIMKKIYRTYVKAADHKLLQENLELRDRIKQAKMDSFTIERTIDESTGELQARPKFVGAE